MYIHLGKLCPIALSPVPPKTQRVKEDNMEIVCLDISMLREDVTGSENKIGGPTQGEEDSFH